MSDENRVYIYDSTLRDGAQTHGVDFSAADKAAITRELDAIGFDYVEGGWPGANPTDDAFFKSLPDTHRGRIAAFGMTRRAGRSAENDPGLQAVVRSGAPVVTLVGKSWDFQCEVALGIEPAENIRMISDSIAHAGTVAEEVMFDAEHFFDGYKANPGFALDCVKAAHESGARWVVLCDTNGGTLPHEVYDIVREVVKVVPGSHVGIHCHNDTENAVANSLAAVRAGARQVQGTLNGLGERCGNANLITIIPTLMLKMGMATGLTDADLKGLTKLSRSLDARLNRVPSKEAAYVGERAFAHKGGLHVSAVAKDPKCYEHVDPDSIGNKRLILVSNQAGLSNILARFDEIGMEVDRKDPRLARLIELVKEREFQGYAYDGAWASFELLARRMLEDVPEYFKVDSFRVIDERRWNARGQLITLSEAIAKLTVQGERSMTVAEGDGPVNALDACLRKLLQPYYPQLSDLRLVDFKVRILNPEAATAAVTRVTIESADGSGVRWTTVGVSENLIDASFEALSDSINFKLHRDGATVSASA